MPAIAAKDTLPPKPYKSDSLYQIKHSPERKKRTRRAGIKVLGITSSLLSMVGGLGRMGLQMLPSPFPAPVISQPAPPLLSVLLPPDLPVPVKRYFLLTYGNHIPVIKTAVLSGRGTLRLFGLTFPMRCRFIHESSRNFRAYFELTFFGRPLIKVNEHFLDGKFRQELPFGVEEGKPKLDHSAAVRMWAEWALWLPAMLLLDPKVYWEAIDEATAILVVPWGEEEERLILRFDPEEGNLLYVEGMKYKHPDDLTKTLWVNAVWFGDKPWTNFKIEEKAYNVPVDTSLEFRGYGTI